MEHTAPVKRSINEFRLIAIGVKQHLNLITDANKNKIDTFFAGADSNNDTMISKEEMTAFADANNLTFTANDMNQAWVILDTDSDGNISYDEFTAIIEEQESYGLLSLVQLSAS